jgi:hypothetical protein
MSGGYGAFAKLNPELVETGLNMKKVGDAESETQFSF